jgi:hypothetical protein
MEFSGENWLMENVSFYTKTVKNKKSISKLPTHLTIMIQMMGVVILMSVAFTCAENCLC